MSGTGNLAAFLAARLDELEAMAKAVAEGIPDVFVGDLTREQVLAIAVLGDITADRAILATYAKVADMDIADPEPEFAYGRAVGLGEAVRIRAARFASHPGYQDKWKP